MAGWIIVPWFIKWILYSKAEKVCPHPIGKVLGKEVVFRAGQPAGQFLTRCEFFVPAWLRAVKITCDYNSLSFWNGQPIDVGLRLLGANKAGPFAGKWIQVRKKGSEFPKLIPCVTSKRVVMALCTFKFHTQKQPAHRGSHILGTRVVGLIKAR